MTATPKPFTLHVPDAAIADLNDRLARTRWPHAVDDSGWKYGVDLAYMQQLVEYWRTNYDWREHERTLNRHPQFKTRIDGLDIHFIHERSKHAEALPLVLIHGWPGSFFEFYKLIGPLTDPTAHGIARVILFPFKLLPVPDPWLAMLVVGIFWGGVTLLGGWAMSALSRRPSSAPRASATP